VLLAGFTNPAGPA